MHSTSAHLKLCPFRLKMSEKNKNERCTSLALTPCQERGRTELQLPSFLLAVPPCPLFFAYRVSSRPQVARTETTPLEANPVFLNRVFVMRLPESLRNSLTLLLHCNLFATPALGTANAGEHQAGDSSFDVCICVYVHAYMHACVGMLVLICSQHRLSTTPT